MPKKILIINTNFSSGGAAGVARNLFYYLNSNGYEAHFAYGRGNKTKEPRTFKFGSLFETLLYVLIVRILGKEGMGTHKGTDKLIEHIKKEKFDLIHLHNLHGYYLNFPVFFKFLKESHIPIIWTLHDEWILNPLKAHSINKYSYPKTFNPYLPKSWFEEKKDLIKGLNIKALVSPAHWLEDKVKNSYLSHFHSRLIRNGVDITLFKPGASQKDLRKKYDLPLNKKIILFGVGDLYDKNKGAKYVFEAAEILKEKDYLFLGIGVGTLEEKNIKILPYMKDRNKLAEIFQASDIFCTASLADTQPLVVLEAFASGLPVVGFDIPGVAELVKKDVGTVVPVRNSRLLAEAISSNLGRMQNSRSHSARNLAMYKFMLRDSMLSYKKLYGEIL